MNCYNCGYSVDCGGVCSTCGVRVGENTIERGVVVNNV